MKQMIHDDFAINIAMVLWYNTIFQMYKVVKGQHCKPMMPRFREIAVSNLEGYLD